MNLAKFQLLTLKNQGVLFFKDDVSSLELHEPFKLYYYLVSHPAIQDAFPVPTDSIHLSKLKTLTFDDVKEYFESYYLNEADDKEGIQAFDLKNPYIGKDYIWFYKRTS